LFTYLFVRIQHHLYQLGPLRQSSYFLVDNCFDSIDTIAIYVYIRSNSEKYKSTHPTHISNFKLRLW